MLVSKTSPPPLPAPWWTFGFVWMVIAGPASVVLASIATVWITLANPDTLVTEDYFRRGMQINKTLAEEAQRRQDRALMPAVQGRNHAASPTPAAAGSPATVPDAALLQAQPTPPALPPSPGRPVTPPRQATPGS